MSFTTLNSSIHLNYSSSFFALSPTTQTTSNVEAKTFAIFSKVTTDEFQPVTKSLAYILGEQISKLAILKQSAKVASFFYSLLPSLSPPMVAASSTTPPCDTFLCPTPIGSYEESCHRPEVTYLPKAYICQLKTRCATIYEGLPHKMAIFRFLPGESIVVLENNNGTLVIRNSREEEVNTRLKGL